MSLRTGWIASCILLLISPLLMPSAIYAQEGQFTGMCAARVIGANQDASGKTLFVKVKGKLPLPLPVIQFFPGADGQTIMAVDFHGLLWEQPSTSFHPSNESIESVRIGQFQSSPPVFRISIITSNPALLRNIDLRCSNDGLLVRFPSKDFSYSNFTAKPAPPLERLAVKKNPDNNRLPSEIPQLRPPIALDDNFAREAMKDVRDAAIEQHAGPMKRAMDRPAERPKVENLSEKVSKAQPQTTEEPAAPAHHRWRFASIFPPLAPSFRHRKQKPDAIDSEKAESPRVATEDNQKSGGPTDFSKSASTSLNAKQPNSKLAAGSGAGKVQPAAERTPPMAPDYHRLLDRRTSAEFPGKLVEESGKPGSGQLTQRNSEQAEPQQENLPSITFTGRQPLQVTIKGCAPVKYRTFRLSDPERFVVDFLDGCPSLDDLPPSPVPELLSGVRTGRPDGDNAGIRLVLDLAHAGILVKDELQSDPRNLTLSLLPQSDENNWAAFSSLPRLSTIVIDAGHGGSDPGAQRGDLREKDMTMGITTKLKALLERRGMKVIMTRSDDTFVSLEDRVKITNEVKPDAFVSVHINSLESDSGICGIETYYQNDCSRALAGKVHQSLVQQLQVPDRSVRKARFYVVNHTPHPAILAEVGFISNKQEREKLMSSDYQGKIAEALSQGIIMYLGETRNQARRLNEDAKAAVAPISGAKSANTGRNILTR